MCTLKCIKLLLSKEGLSLARRFSLPPRRKVRNPCRAPQPDRVINGRSPDLRVFTYLDLPVIKQWHIPGSLTAYSCGGSRRIGFRLTAFPFHSLTRLGLRDHQMITISYVRKIKTNCSKQSFLGKCLWLWFGQNL